MPAPKRNIVATTIACPHCGHRCLPENLQSHIHRIHLDVESDMNFVQSLRKTRSKTWWEKASELKDDVPLSAVYSEVVKEPDPTHRPQKRKIYLQRPTTPKAPTSPKFPKAPKIPMGECGICGNPVPLTDLEKHRAHHIFNQPYRHPEEIHCPECGLNLKYTSLKNHYQKKHPKISTSAGFLKEVMENEYYGADDFHQEQTSFGPILVTRRGWAKCPKCNIYIQKHRFERHFAKVHGTI